MRLIPRVGPLATLQSGGVFKALQQTPAFASVGNDLPESGDGDAGFGPGEALVQEVN